MILSPRDKSDNRSGDGQFTTQVGPTCWAAQGMPCYEGGGAAAAKRPSLMTLRSGVRSVGGAVPILAGIDFTSSRIKDGIDCLQPPTQAKRHWDGAEVTFQPCYMEDSSKRLSPFKRRYGILCCDTHRYSMNGLRLSHLDNSSTVSIVSMVNSNRDVVNDAVHSTAEPQL